MIESLGIGRGVGELECPTNKVRSSVREFEAMLIADLLKMAEQEKLSNEPGMESYDDMRTQAIAMAMARQGGIGIGKLLISQLDKGSAGHIKDFSDSADPIIAGHK